MIFDDVSYGRMMQMREDGKTTEEIAKQLRVSHRTVRYWKSRDAPSEARRTSRRMSKKAQSVLTKRRRWVKKLILSFEMQEGVYLTPKRRLRRVRQRKVFLYPSPQAVARQLGVIGMPTSASTVRRDLIHLGLVAKTCRRGPILTDRHKSDRVKFCKQMLRDGLDIIFSDEKQITSNDAAPRFQWCFESDLPEPRECEQGAAALCLWGAIGRDFKVLHIMPRTILDREKYQQDVLKPNLHALQVVTARSDKSVLMQDNARAHCGSHEFLSRRRVRTLPTDWPALSCDLNPIEQLWSILDRRVKKKGPWGVEQLADFIRAEFDAIPMTTINKLVGSFEKRCKKCISAKGCTIKP